MKYFPTRGGGDGLSSFSGLFGLSRSADQKDKSDKTDQMTYQNFVVSEASFVVRKQGSSLLTRYAGSAHD
jgi:hypothetical protein